MTKLPARTGLEWLKQGFALFRRNSGVFIMMMFVQLLTMLVLATIPVLGGVIAVLLIPSFAIGVQQACHLIDEGKPVTVAVLGTGFQKTAIRPLCKLGAVYLAAMVVVMLAVTPFIDQTALQEAYKSMQAGAPPQYNAKVQTAALFNLLMIALIGIIMVLLSFAPGLTYWKAMPTFKAIFYSFFAVIGAMLPILTMLLAGVGLFFALSLVVQPIFGRTQLGTVILAWFSLLLSLVLQCGMYAAYKQILGAPEGEPPLK